MLRFSLNLAVASTGALTFEGSTLRGGWLRRRAKRECHEAFQTVFSAHRDDGFVPVGSLAVEAEILRLLPHTPRADVRTTPSVCVYSLNHGRQLNVDVWNADCAHAGAQIADLATTAAREVGISCGLTVTSRPLVIQRSAGTAYAVDRFVDAKGAEPMTPDTFDERFETMVYAGLVASALRAADPLDLLERIPSPSALGLYVDAYPFVGTRRAWFADARKSLMHCEFSMDILVTGAWRIGAWALFGAGMVDRANAREPNYPDATREPKPEHVERRAPAPAMPALALALA